MKAERRHQLQENSLIRTVRNFPEFWRAYGSKILLGIILILLAIMLIRLWINKRAETRKAMAEELYSARASLESLRSVREVTIPDQRMAQFDPDAMQPSMKPEAVAEQRRRTWSKVELAVSNVLQNSSEAAQLADAKLLRADANYHFGLLASLGQSSGANKTRGIDSPPEEYFERAGKDYSEVIGQAANIQPSQVAAARLGMAAVHECRNQPAEARAFYELVQREGPDEVSRLQATNRLRVLAAIKPDQYIATQTLSDIPPPMRKPTSQATQPTTGAATTQAATSQATTMPATTMPATTMPASTAPTSTTPPTTLPAATLPSTSTAPATAP
jgi:hypothetical protein